MTRSVSFVIRCTPTKELGRLLSTVTLARHQVWLPQLPLSEVCRRTLHSLQVSQVRRMGQLLFRPWSKVYRLARLSSSLQAYDEQLCLIPGLGPLWYPMPIALNHFQVDNRGATAPRAAFQAPRGPAPSTAPPVPLGAGGVGT